ncbi:hypothetical protein CL64_gp54 [Mycobacterium phage Liefie]|uniref:Uncharacterized protein n=1 Tax=Mycobacterium phage Liefie TaxID=2922994 RepID=G1JY28_9CAUD|nr:hypothetical protein CL64_gp54 [Mycobacterium phage Liefie]AEL98526.1 hypothetical protein LIEFIE_54 [Mycobacterium phage Liefie]
MVNTCDICRQCVTLVDMSDPTSQNPHNAYYAAKTRVVEALTELGATSPETAVIGAKLGIQLDDDAAMVAAAGAEVRYRAGVGYWLGRTRNNGRA